MKTQYMHVKTGTQDTREGWIESYDAEELKERGLTAEQAFDEDVGNTLCELDGTQASAKTIDELEVGTIVHGAYGYSRIEKCVHGNQYYAYIGSDYDGQEDVIDVCDDGESHIECCS